MHLRHSLALSRTASVRSLAMVPRPNSTPRSARLRVAATDPRGSTTLPATPTSPAPPPPPPPPPSSVADAEVGESGLARSPFRAGDNEVERLEGVVGSASNASARAMASSSSSGAWGERGR